MVRLKGAGHSLRIDPFSYDHIPVWTGYGLLHQQIRVNLPVVIEQLLSSHSCLMNTGTNTRLPWNAVWR